MGVVLNWSAVHTRRSEGERKTENYVKKDCRERVKQSGVEELFHATEGCSDSVEALCATGATRHDDDDDDDDYYYFSIHLSVPDLNKQLLVCA